MAEGRETVQDCGNPPESDASRVLPLRRSDVTVLVGLTSEIGLPLPGELLVNGWT